MRRWISAVRPSTLPERSRCLRVERRAREHAVLGGNPALAGVREKRRHAVLRDRRAEDAGIAHLDEDRGGRGLEEMPRDPHGAQLASRPPVGARHQASLLQHRAEDVEALVGLGLRDIHRRQHAQDRVVRAVDVEASLEAPGDDSTRPASESSTPIMRPLPRTSLMKSCFFAKPSSDLRKCAPILTRVLEEALLLDGLEDREPRRAGERVAAEGRGVRAGRKGRGHLRACATSRRWRRRRPAPWPGS